MKIIITIIISFMIGITGCSNKTVSENEFKIIWKEYLQKEFEESFDEKQSTAQREKLLAEILKNYDFNLETFKNYMKKKHENKYKKIFLK